MGTGKKYPYILFLLSCCIFAAQLSAFAVKNTSWIDSSIAGIWKGTSLCQVKNSPCHDELVVYHISKQADSAGYKVVMNKIVNEKEESMGELIFSYNRVKQELRSDKMRDALWIFHINDNQMSGQLYYKNVLYRMIKVSRE